MAVRRARGRFVRPAPRTTLWIGQSLVGVNVSASASTLLHTLNAAVLALRPFTIIRTRIVIHFASDQSSASEFTQAAYSQQVVTDSAAAAGIGSVPTPVTESEADYFVYQSLFQSVSVNGTPGSLVVDNGQGANWTNDSKAARKVGIDDQVVGVIEVVSAVGGFFAMDGRQLLKLH